MDEEGQSETCSQHRSLHPTFQSYQFLGPERDSFPGEPQSSKRGIVFARYLTWRKMMLMIKMDHGDHDDHDDHE